MTTAVERLSICVQCPQFRGHRIGGAAIFRCGECHCSLASNVVPGAKGKKVEIRYTGKDGVRRTYHVLPIGKTQMKRARCPLNKWPNTEADKGSVSETDPD